MHGSSVPVRGLSAFSPSSLFSKLQNNLAENDLLKIDDWFAGPI